MFSKSQSVNCASMEMMKEIKSDLIKTFRDKGIDVSKVLIDMKQDSVNIRVCISKDCDCGMELLNSRKAQ